MISLYSVTQLPHGNKWVKQNKLLFIILISLQVFKDGKGNLITSNY